MAASDWYTLYTTATGVIRGHTSEVGLPSPVPAGITVVNHGPNRMDQTNRWDASTRTWVPIPPPVVIDRLQDLANHPFLSQVWTRLTVAQRTQLRKAMVWLLGGYRFRQELEEVSLNPPEGWPVDPANATE